MSRKLRVLFSGEASFLSTGFATYHKNILSLLHQTGKYELAEFASYGSSLDARRISLPWLYYGNEPNPGEDRGEFNSNPVNQFGKWRLEDVILNFRPDVILDIRDVWMLTHVISSPMRDYFKLAIMPTVDSAPHRAEWIANYAEADIVATYSDWSLDVLKQEGGDLLNLLGSASPGANHHIYKPVENKSDHKQKCGIDPNWFIVGTVMRNQKRKLFPELFRAFRMFLDKNPKYAERAFLYCHTGYPDLGWNIPFLIKEHGLSRKVLFTYICRECNTVFPSFYQDIRTFCPNCNKPSAATTNVGHGASEDAMASIYNLFDVYVQYPSNEGFGMPQVEACYCGIPTIGINYSATKDITQKTNGSLIRPVHMYLEVETTAYKAIPNNKDLVSTLEVLIDLKNEELLDIGQKTRELAVKNYNYEKSSRLWESYFDTINTEELDAVWSRPPQFFEPSQNMPQNLTPTQFIEWAFSNVLGEPEKTNSYFGLQLTQYLNQGMIPSNPGGAHINEESILGSQINYQPCDHNTIINILKDIRNQKNYWEQVRCGLIKRPIPQFIAQARHDAQIKGIR